MFSASLQFWVILQLVVDLFLIILFIIFVRQFKAGGASLASSRVEPLPQGLEPLLKEAEKVAGQFETQLKEKQRLVKRLNEHLDSRIISLNLLLNRAEVCEKKPHKHVYDLQEQIIALGVKGLGPQEIANRMGISKGEVTLVLELKRKFQEMEKDS
ncbi:MAG: hypothetical protein KAV83_01290 [Desulfobacterales bacterium]|nr:hypothetical protein [Desulfobacterales bacterium]